MKAKKEKANFHSRRLKEKFLIKLNLARFSSSRSGSLLEKPFCSTCLVFSRIAANCSSEISPSRRICFAFCCSAANCSSEITPSFNKYRALFCKASALSRISCLSFSLSMFSILSFHFPDISLPFSKKKKNQYTAIPNRFVKARHIYPHILTFRIILRPK